MPSKVFSRDGTELQLGCYEIVSPRHYHILVLFEPGKPDKLVSCTAQTVRLKTFLVGWAGRKKGFEERCCAVRKFGPSSPRFSKDFWEDDPVDVEPSRSNLAGVDVSQERERKEVAQKKRKSIGSASCRPATPAQNSLSDEEEPDWSPADQKHTPSSNRLFVKALPEFGPQRPLARHLVESLEEWHRRNPTEYPPCRYQGIHLSRPPALESKVFARDGTEVELACYKIMTPRNYSILVLCPSNGPHKIVGCAKRRPKNGTFLIGWAGRDGFEPRCCAVRVFGSTLDDVNFSPGLWDDEPSVAALSDGPKVKKTAMNKRKSTGSAIRRASPSPSSSSDEEEFAAEESPENESSEEEAPRSKRQRSNRHNHNDHHNHSNHDDNSNNNNNQSTNTTSSAKETNVVFKLVSNFADATRSFPSDECATGRYLFAKAKEFFRLFDPDAEVKVLSCRIPARHERPYLFEGKEGEFRLLLEDLKESTIGAVNNILTVEIKCVA